MDAEAQVRSVKHWHHDFEVAPGIWTGGSYRPHGILEWMALPERLDGVRALDIGASDGFFTLAMARRGADVTAVDYRPKHGHGFAVMEALSGIRCEYLHANLFDLDARQLGQFDLVLFLGVLYHLPDPYRGLSMVSSLVRPGGHAYIETVAVSTPSVTEPVLQFFPNRSMKNDLTNFWAPNLECLKAMTSDVGFEVERHSDLSRPAPRWAGRCWRRNA